jgi:hypothetical protein
VVGDLQKRCRLLLNRAVGIGNGHKSPPRGKTGEIQNDNLWGPQERSQDYEVRLQHGICLLIVQ